MAKIISLSSYLPKEVLTNEQISLKFPNWSAEKIFDKTGIKKRHIADQSQGSDDLAFNAAQNLFKKNININKNDIDNLILVTQTASDFIPSSACKIHKRLGLDENCSAFDLNQGCSGFIYGLQVASSMIDSKRSKYTLLLTADVYSKIINKDEANLYTLFGDAGTATLIGPDNERDCNRIGPFIFGTDGNNFDKLICKNNLFDFSENNFLFMDGPSILEFTLKKIPEAINRFLKKTSTSLDDFEYVIFHQANKFILEKLYKKIGISEKGLIEMSNCGNTVSSSIPIVLEHLQEKSSYKKSNILLVGFGSGLSWGVTSIIF